MARIRVPPGRSWIRGAAVAAGPPVAATVLALLLNPQRAFGAVSLFLLAVVVSAALGGLWSGLASSLLGFLSLNFFFTAPRFTLEVALADDVVALAVFLVSSLVVGSLFARVLRERRRATRREHESRLLSAFAIRLLPGEPLESVLHDMASSLLEPLELERCEIHAAAGGRPLEVVEGGPGTGGATAEFRIEVGGNELGTLRTVRRTDRGSLPEEDRRLLGAVARQIALTLERARLDSQVTDARAEAEANRARAALFSSVTHDLRTPLASIKAAVTSLLQEDVRLGEEERRDLLVTVLEETNRLNRVVGDLLDLARIRAGALVPSKEAIAVDEVVESVLHRMRAQMSGLRVRTILRDAPDVHVDPVQIDQVLTNVLENAVRFSPPDGEILISVAPWRDSVEVRVADQGPGIPAEERERVFEAFYRHEDGMRSGTGLGLAIARAIVVAHGGRIWIEGAPTGGTAVVLRLPVGRVEPPRPEAAAS